MSDTSDVKVLTVNQKTVFNTSAAIERVKIHNNSSFFLRVYFGADAPASATDSGWHDTIDPGGTPLMAIVGASSQVFTNRTFVQSTPYQGVITILPFLPVGALMSAGGSITGGALCYLTGYYPGEWAQEGGEIEAFVQAAKQQRSQVVWGGIFNSIGTVTQLTPDGRFGQAVAVLDPTIFPNLFADNANGVTIINAYIFGYFASFRALAAGTVIDYFIDIAETNAAENVIRFFQEAIRVNFAAVNGDGKSFSFAPAAPINIPISIPQGQLGANDHIFARFRVGGGGFAAGQYSITNNFTWFIDGVNQTTLMFMPGVNPNSPIFPAYNGNTNPQTF